MFPIQYWRQGSLTKLCSVRVVATIEAQCNLACQHCYWAHDLNFKSIEDWGPAAQRLCNLNIPLLYAGRLLTKPGGQFLRTCIDLGVKKIGIIDNGWTILQYPQFLPHYDHINISIDGWREAHDIQRGRIGAFDRAWNTVVELKRQGFDPLISAAFSPHSFKDWNRFEDLLAEHDVPMSSTLVWSLPEPSKRGLAIFTENNDLIRAFEVLLNGTPKLISIYALEHIQALWPVLRTLAWSLDTEDGDCVIAEINGSTVVYRPASLVPITEIALHWDGGFYTPPTYGEKFHIESIPQRFWERIHTLNTHELSVWSDSNLMKGGELCQA